MADENSQRSTRKNTRSSRKTSSRKQSQSAGRKTGGGRTHTAKRKQGGGHGRNNNRSTKNTSRSRKQQSGGQRRTQQKTAPKKKQEPIPSPEKGVFRVIPLGGVEEVGKNMYVFEYGDDIVVVDAGFQFVGEEEAPGVDYILPNTKYLEERKHKIRALVVTHGHLDHIGGIPYLMERIGNPPIYARELTNIMIKKRQDEFPQAPAIDYKTVEPNERISFNDMSMRFLDVTHSIPDSMGVILECPYGNVVISGDLKLDHNDETPTKAEDDKWTALGKENNLLFLADSTNAEQPGFSVTERTVHKNLEELIKNAESRLIIGTFASQFERMIKIVEIAEKYNKKIVTEGRSIRTNMEVAQKAGLLTPKKDTIISAADIANYPPDRIVVIATGAQGEEFAALMRIATKQHKYIALKEQDTVILSSSIIPGNELNVQKLKDNLYRQGSKVIHYRTSEVHSTGHANQGELAWITKKVNPRFFAPAFGYHSMLRVHADVIREQTDIPKDHIIIPDDGTIIDLENEGKEVNIHKQRAPSEVVMVDGFAVGDIQEVVLRDRQALAQDGIFVVIAAIDLRTGKVRKSPDIISRGFVYLRESQDMLRQARFITKRTIEDMAQGMHPIDFEVIKRQISDDLGRFLLQETAKRPIVLPVLLGV